MISPFDEGNAKPERLISRALGRVESGAKILSYKLACIKKTRRSTSTAKKRVRQLRESCQSSLTTSYLITIPTPLANLREPVRPPHGPLSAILQTFKRATSKHLHSSPSHSPLLTLTLAAPAGL